jgi:16S rRNA (cytosine967-C5)-methyltransferase
MHYLWQHIKTIINTYNGGMPLSHFLKNHFRQFPILGSRDRRMVSTITYSWYRCSASIVFSDASGYEFENKVRECLVLCKVPMEVYSRLFAAIPPSTTTPHTDLNRIFSHNLNLSPGISREEWLASILVQPQLFIRIRKNKEKICALLTEKQIPFESVSTHCLSLPNGAAIDTFLPADSYVVQDASSQKTGDFFVPAKGESWYDCCAGAGGKSLLLMDKGVPVNLTVTDKRESILKNLETRFRQYGYRKPTTYVADASDGQALNVALKSVHYDNIICDAPCSGSGTWARTPEQMYFFEEKSLAAFSSLQQKIATNAARHLKKGGKLIYITCSVFGGENEEVVQEVTERGELTLVQQQLISGIDIHADSMFIAVLEKL